jgi:hypothetical protein
MGPMPARTSKILRLVILIVIVVGGSATPAWAQAKTDIITLRNGDRITGEVVSVNRGRLELKTDDAGTIDIEWDKVAEVEAGRLFEVETSAGRRLLGSLSGTTVRTLIVSTQTEVVQLLMDDVTSIRPIGTSFWSKLEGSIDAGFSYTHSSGIAQATLSSSTLFRRPGSLFRLDGSATLTENRDGNDDDDRASLGFSYLRYRGPRWFVAATGRLENNKSLGLVLRSQVGGAIGPRLINTNRSQLEVAGGLVGNNEQGVDTEPTQNLEGLLAARTSFYSYDKPKTTIDASFQYYPSFSQWGRQRIQMDAAFRREFLKDLTISFSTYYTFDSKPPQTGAKRTDIGLVMSIGWTFGS